ncbi:helix-turn-helix transcriptional regulator [Streptomyces sp. NBC_00433]
MNAHGQLADFLQARRGRLSPADVGLPTYGDRRRVPGLRREELALLAGVSAPYYARLEQGQSHNASPEILDALATALRLDDSERAHLHLLAELPRRRRTPRPRPERMSAATRALLTALGDTPALVLGRRTDVLAWNRTGHALLAGHLDSAAPETPATRPNMARLVFLDAHTRDLYTRWEDKAKAVVGGLRQTAAGYPDDPETAALIGELAMRSPDFARWWADHRVVPCDTADYELRHPLVGPLTLTQQTLQSPAGQGPRLVVATAEAGSAAEAALALLTHTLGTVTTPAPPPRATAR